MSEFSSAAERAQEKQRAKRELSEKQIAFVIWRATPDGIRDPATRDEFCTAIGVSRQTGWRWERDPRVMDAVRFVVLQNAGDPQRVNQVLDMVFEEAIEKKNLKAAELWIKAVGVMNQLSRGSSILDAMDDESSFTNFSTEELERIREEMAAQKLENDSIENAKKRLASIGSYDEMSDDADS